MIKKKRLPKRPLTITEFAAMGGHARARKLTKAQASEIGRKAVAARELKRAAKKEKAASKQLKEQP